MFKRLSWLTIGTGLGFGLAVWGRRKVQATVERYRPSAVTATWTKRLRRFGDDLRAAGHEGRSAMRRREAELRASAAKQEVCG
ncbi:MAG: hypothetical protein ACR2G7_13375, partial [Acidimicrobiales bacterium]